MIYDLSSPMFSDVKRFLICVFNLFTRFFCCVLKRPGIRLFPRREHDGKMVDLSSMVMSRGAGIVSRPGPGAEIRQGRPQRQGKGKI